MDIVKYGHIPEAMEDHWFMYCDETTTRYYRSWTGICIFVARYEDDGSQCRISELQVNSDPDQYRGKGDEKDVALFLALLTEEYGGNASIFSLISAKVIFPARLMVSINQMYSLNNVGIFIVSQFCPIYNSSSAFAHLLGVKGELKGS